MIGNSWIPEVSKKRIEEIAVNIKPVVRFKDGELYYLEPVDLFNVSYIWSPKLTTKAINLISVCDIKTYHTYGYYGFFKPSVAEVLAQIPVEQLEKVIAFEIVGMPENAEDLNREIDAINAGYHVATTRLYVRE